tara:strand:+ start:3010 stop:3906 length:897 start_codon:yes stop_codon:yes gene_type:complete
MRVSFLWWNTSLSPARGESANSSHKDYAIAKLNFLIEELGIDFLALGEVSESDVAMLKENCTHTNYELLNGCEKAGRTKFDSCILYDSSIFEFKEIENITYSKAGQTLKVGQRYSFLFSSEMLPIHFFVSHWPSRHRTGKGAPNRATLGERLRDAVDEILENYGEEALIVLLGDYNDEPFDVSMSDHLLATRDRELVRKKPRLLYNPFWRHLGHSGPKSHDLGEPLVDGGTYYYKSDPYCRWRTFDQIIVSSKLLDETGWHINEEFTKSLRIEGFGAKILDRNEKFDHFPVISAIERR